MSTEIEELRTTRDRLGAPQLAAIGGLLVVVLAAVWFFVLRGDGAPDPSDAPPAPAAAEPATPEPEPTDGPGGRGGDRAPGGTFEVFAARDPFDPLVSPAASEGGAATTGGASTAPTTTTGGATISAAGDVATPSGGGTTDPAGASATGGASVGGHRVRVVDVYRRDGRDVAQIEVDGTVYTVNRGETFADGFTLESTSNSCATLSSGADTFTLCEGEQILK
jgi:hypothetical protein